MKEKMCINTEELVEKINSFSEVLSNDLVVYIERLVVALNQNDPKDKITNIYYDLESYHNNEVIHEFLDSMRHAFASFSSGGLYDLYVFQENESWYPKVILSKELIPNDIDKLSDKINLFRGCSLKEHSEELYGQAWTTSKTIAEMFAYQHYEHKPWYRKSDRAVIKTTFPKKGVLFSKQSIEFEVVIDTKFLGNVEISQ